jgi:hypothetical protein
MSERNLRLKRPRIERLGIEDWTGILGDVNPDTGLAGTPGLSSRSSRSRSEPSSFERNVAGYAASRTGGKIGGMLGFTAAKDVLGLTGKTALGLGLTGAALGAELATSMTRGKFDVDVKGLLAGLVGYTAMGPVGFFAGRKAWSLLQDIMGWNKNQLSDLSTFDQDVYGYLDMLDEMNMSWEDKIGALEGLGYTEDPIGYDLDFDSGGYFGGPDAGSDDSEAPGGIGDEGGYGGR